MTKKYSTEAGDLLQLFMDLAVKVKNLYSYPDGWLVIEGFAESGSTNVFGNAKMERKTLYESLNWTIQKGL